MLKGSNFFIEIQLNVVEIAQIKSTKVPFPVNTSAIKHSLGFIIHKKGAKFTISSVLLGAKFLSSFFRHLAAE